jgi:hypothetical protein
MALLQRATLASNEAEAERFASQVKGSVRRGT